MKGEDDFRDFVTGWRLIITMHGNGKREMMFFKISHLSRGGWYNFCFLFCFFSSFPFLGDQFEFSRDGPSQGKRPDTRSAGPAP